MFGSDGYCSECQCDDCVKSREVKPFVYHPHNYSKGYTISVNEDANKEKK